MIEDIQTFVKMLDPFRIWANENQGLVAVSIYIITLTLGWGSGIFTAIRRRPKFKLSIIDGPTFCCTFEVGKKYNDHDVHRTCIAIYLKISNVESASSSIEEIHIGYKWDIRPGSMDWFKYRVGRFWLVHQTAALSDFRVSIGGNIKVFPFLTQRSIIFSSDGKLFLEIGKSENGIVYFEQPESWGGCFPYSLNGHTNIAIRVLDVFGKRHQITKSIPVVSIAQARVYNPDFGKTHAELHGETFPHDRPEPQKSSSMKEAPINLSSPSQRRE